MEKLGYIQLLRLLQRREGQAFSGMHLRERDKALLLNPEERVFSYRHGGSAQAQSNRGVSATAELPSPAGGVQLWGNLKLGTGPRKQAAGLELSWVSRGCQPRKHPKTTPRYPCQREAGLQSDWGTLQSSPSATIWELKPCECPGRGILHVKPEQSLVKGFEILGRNAPQKSSAAC